MNHAKKVDAENAAFDAATSAESAVAVRRQVLLAPFSADRDFNPTLVADEIHSLAQMNAAAIIEIGKRLVWARNSMPHGDFQQWCREDLPFSLRTAYNYMNVAEKIGKCASVAHINLSLAKVYELAALPDADLAELEREGKLGDIDADELEKMTATELRARIRRQTTKLDKTRADIRAKDAAIDQLGEDLLNAKASSIPPDLKKVMKSCLVGTERVAEDLARFAQSERFASEEIAREYYKFYADLRVRAELAYIEFVEALNESGLVAATVIQDEPA